MNRPLHHSPLASGPPPHEAKLRGEDLFAASAHRLAGLAGALLGWRPGEFWDATPAELGAVFSALNPQDATPDGDALAGLMEMFPDG